MLGYSECGPMDDGVSQVLLKNKRVLMALWRIAISGSGCFQSCPCLLIKSKIKGKNKHCKFIFVCAV